MPQTGTVLGQIKPNFTSDFNLNLSHTTTGDQAQEQHNKIDKEIDEFVKQQRNFNTVKKKKRAGRIVGSSQISLRASHFLKNDNWGMLKFTLQPGGQSDMVWCYSGLKIDECNLKSYNSRPNVSTLLSSVFIRGDLVLQKGPFYTLTN